MLCSGDVDKFCKRGKCCCTAMAECCGGFFDNCDGQFVK